MLVPIMLFVIGFMLIGIAIRRLYCHRIVYDHHTPQEIYVAKSIIWIILLGIGFAFIIASMDQIKHPLSQRVFFVLPFLLLTAFHHHKEWTCQEDRGICSKEHTDRQYFSKELG